ncbi:MAG: glycosyltransferase, partial [Acidobacteriaceae bacterium]|nr:glycosyltransferase [Acidobacteriaceae bacterium]
QIFFSDPAKRREETGLTESWWDAGRLRVSHRIDPEVDRAFPCAYPGGGSSAFDRRKFLELGGFDELLRPFYYEDTDLGHMAWKRGWKVLYEPRSVVFHEHRGTIGQTFSKPFINTVLKKNSILYCWKNIHDGRMLVSHFGACLMTSVFAMFAQTSAGRSTSLGLLKATLQLREAIRARWRAREFAVISDREAFRRQKGGYFRDRFEAPQSVAPSRLQVLFASPYPIEPPVHGGAVFMKSTLEALAPLADVHLISFLDNASQLKAQEPLRNTCASVEFIPRQQPSRRNPASLLPRVVDEFASRDFDWAINRITYLKRIDVVQLEYTMLGQYGVDFNSIPSFLFEHDIAFQSMGRRLTAGDVKPGTAVAYMQLLRYELNILNRFTRVQVCSRENQDYLLQFVPQLRGRIDPDLRAIVNTRAYTCVAAGREPDTMLFVGSFNHAPNVQALSWFLERVFPRVIDNVPEARLVVAGSGRSKELGEKLQHPNLELKGFVPDVRELLERHAVFLCPILSGSGIRVKLMEAFASGIPVVSTTLGAEGLTKVSGDVCELADSPNEFAAAVIRLLQNPAHAAQMAARARSMIEREKDASTVTARLERVYRNEVARRRPVADTAIALASQNAACC